MKLGYIRESKQGPSVAEQREALRLAGVTDDDRVYVDGMPKRRKGPVTVDDLPMRREVLRCLRQGDVLLVPSLDRLGLTIADILAAVQAVSEAGGALLDLAKGKTHQWSPEAAALAADAAEAEQTLRREHLKRARLAQKETGATGGRPWTPAEKLNMAWEMWRDPEISAAEVAMRVGVKARTLYDHLGAKSDAVAGKPRPKRERKQRSKN